MHAGEKKNAGQEKSERKHHCNRPPLQPWTDFLTYPESRLIAPIESRHSVLTRDHSSIAYGFGFRFGKLFCKKLPEVVRALSRHNETTLSQSKPRHVETLRPTLKGKALASSVQ